MLHSAKQFCLFVLLLMIFSFKTIYSQTISNGSNIRTGDQDQTTRIKWTWQLPLQIKNAFNKSEYASWYIEKIEKCNLEGKVVYKFYIDNGNLLDGDHHDSFLKENCIAVSSQEQVVHQ